MATPPDRLYGIARQVLDIAHGAITDPPERHYVSDGPLVAWDCEQVVVTAETMTGHAGDVSVEDQSPIGCLVMRAALLGVWVVRCAPTMDDDGDPPSAAAIDTNAAVMLQDPLMVANALVAAYRAGTLSHCHGISLQGWQGIGPEGGLTGGVLRLRIDLTAV